VLDPGIWCSSWHMYVLKVLISVDLWVLLIVYLPAKFTVNLFLDS
jgi:hypothetical protein